VKKEEFPAVPPHVLVAIAMVSLSLPLLAWSLLARPSRLRRRSVTNLQRGLEPRLAGDAPPQADSQRTGGLGSLVRGLTPGRSVRRLDRMLSRAGRPPAWPLERVLAAKLILPPLFAALSLYYIQRAAPGPLPVLVGVVATVVSYFLPDLLLHSRGQERSNKITLELPDTLDQMTIAVEAGLGFDSAMARAGKNGKGPLAEEMVRTLQDMQVGQSRRQAYESLGTRADVPDLRKFVRAIASGDKYGVSVADVLRTQAAEMRMKRRQRAEQKAMQIPVKVIFPLMLCILPVLFIVLLGPAILDVLRIFR
jgi:tight adherence protein C